MPRLMITLMGIREELNRLVGISPTLCPWDLHREEVALARIELEVIHEVLTLISR